MVELDWIAHVGKRPLRDTILELKEAGMDFALNQKTAPKLGFAAFLDLAAELGCVGIEPRNDLGRPVFDGIEPAHAAEMARERGLRFIGLSEVYPFNDWNEDRRAAVARLIETAQAAGARERELDTESEKGGGNAAVHPLQHRRTRDDVGADLGGKQPVADKHDKRQSHENETQRDHMRERMRLLSVHELRQEGQKEHRQLGI